MEEAQDIINKVSSDSSKKLSNRKQKVLDWLKKDYNLYLVGILLLALVVRLYYFSLTMDQTLWWDEAEYMLKAKAIFFNTPDTGWAAQREIVVPFLWGIFYSIINSEFLPRIFQIIVSLGTVFLTYLVGKEIYNKKAGLIASFIVAVNGVHLFFTERLLVYLWAPMFYLLVFYFFWKGYVKGESNKYFYFSALIAGIGISIYGSLAFGVLAMGLFLLITEQHKFLLKKQVWIAGIIGLISLLPLFIYNFISYGSITARWTAFSATASNAGSNPAAILSYIKMFPHLFGDIFSILIALGFVFLIFLIMLSFDFIIKNKDKNSKAHLFVIIWALAVLGFYTYAAYSGESIYDAFIMPSFPALALIASQGILLINKIPFDKKILTFLLITILLIGGYLQLTYANSLISNKINSFDDVKKAGLWIKENSNEGDIVLSKSRPQLTYYSERETYGFSNSTENIEKQIKELKPKYYVDSIFEPTEDYIHSFASTHPEILTPVHAYFLDPQNTQPSLIIYEVNSSSF